MRVVLDTNVLVSALLWEGLPNKILKLIEEDALTLCIHEFILKELRDVLQRPKFKNRIKECNTSTEELLTGILELSSVFPDIAIPSVVKKDTDPYYRKRLSSYGNDARFGFRLRLLGLSYKL